MKTALLLTISVGLCSFACNAPIDAETGSSQDAVSTSPSDTPLPETVKLSCHSAALGHTEITLSGGVRTSSWDVAFSTVEVQRSSGAIEKLEVDGSDVRASYSLPIIDAERVNGARVSVAVPASGIESWPDVCYAKAPNPSFSIGLFAPSGKVDPQWSTHGPSAGLSLKNPRVQAALIPGVGFPSFGPDMLDGKTRCEGAVAGYRGPESVDMVDLACTITTSGVAPRR